jgi:putative selenate reductase molybdopterin-binding subunit
MSDRPARAVINRPEWRIEGAAKATGEAPFLADLRPAGLLYVAFARSPYPHARVVAVNVERARAMPGVAAVLAGADVRPLRLGRRLQDWPLLAWETVRFVGDPVAAVAAETLAEAEAAAASVTVDYEELPAVFDPLEALAANAPILHPDATAYRYLGGLRPPVGHPNIQGHVRHEHGEVDAAFASAAHVFEDEYHVARNFHGHLEPHGSLVWMEGERFHVQSTNKSPFRLRDHLEGSLDIPADQLVIDSGFIGGDFGGKGFSADDYLLIVMARRTGRPIRSVPRFADDLRATNTRHAAVLRIRTGVDADGRILAHEAVTVFDGGAYAAAKGNVGLVPGGSLHTLAGYHVPAARVDVTSVYTNQVPGGHARAPGQPQNTFAAESHVDRIARALGIEPLELRLRNAIRTGGTDVLGRAWTDASMVDVVETLRRESGWDRPLPPGRGRGMAIGTRASPSGGRDATVELRVLDDGRVEVLAAVPEQGGGAHTMLQRVVAEALGVPTEAVVVRRGTTAEAAYDLGVGGSRVTPVVGGAALEAATALAARLERDWPGRSRLDQLAAAGGATVTGRYDHRPGLFSTYAFAVEVEVDGETGQVRVVDGTFVADVGTVINPLGLRGQLLGALVAGYGHAVMEEVVIEDGTIITANLGDYKLPTMPDVPPLRIVLVPGHPGGGPFGAKGAGELGNVPVAPAIANAIEDAAGCRVRSLPITAEKVFLALRQPQAASVGP